MFKKPSIFDYYFEVKNRIEGDIKSQSDGYILSVNQEEYIDYLLEKKWITTNHNW